LYGRDPAIDLARCVSQPRSLRAGFEPSGANYTFAASFSVVFMKPGYEEGFSFHPSLFTLHSSLIHLPFSAGVP
jgi:hypothetical protein